MRIIKKHIYKSSQQQQQEKLVVFICVVSLLLYLSKSLLPKFNTLLILALIIGGLTVWLVASHPFETLAIDAGLLMLAAVIIPEK